MGQAQPALAFEGLASGPTSASNGLAVMPVCVAGPTCSMSQTGTLVRGCLNGADWHIRAIGTYRMRGRRFAVPDSVSPATRPAIKPSKGRKADRRVGRAFRQAVAGLATLDRIERLAVSLVAGGVGRSSRSRFWGG